jgi:peptidoglycan/xylan/chitin deacetylase (PgdA/CDA1 family)
MPPPSLTVLMYHALLNGQGGCDGADPHYAVSAATFDRHLDIVRAAGRRPASVLDILARGGEGRVAFTFDDGHGSNADAARSLIDVGGTADLFVNPARVGSRNHLDWPALRALAEAGISIQSHGHTHRYFNEMDDVEARDELKRSKEAIEDRLGLPVTLFAPPGGRLTPRVAGIARDLGYRALCSSRAALWRDNGSHWQIPRLAVLAGTGDAQFRRWIEQDRREMARLEMRHGVLSAAKALLGNRGYERLRAVLQPSPPTGGAS